MLKTVLVLKDKLLFLAVLLFVGCTAKQKTEHLPYYNTADFTPHWINDKGKANKEITHRINEFSFSDQEGNIVSNQTVNGKIHVANFFFTTCSSICPKMMLNLKTVQKA